MVGVVSNQKINVSWKEECMPGFSMILVWYEGLASLSILKFVGVFKLIFFESFI